MKRQTKFSVLIIVYVFLLLTGEVSMFGLNSISIVEAATYYVATDGNNSNPGTEAQPWGTINHAADVMVAGDTVLVREGTYNVGAAPSWHTPAVNPANSGTANAPITFKAYHGETVIVRASSGNTIGSYQKDYIVWDGFTVFRKVILMGGERDNKSSWIKGCVLQNCIIEGTYAATTDNYDGIRIQSAFDTIISDNIIRNVKGDSLNACGIKLYYTENTLVEHNDIYGNTTGIFDKELGINNIYRKNLIHDNDQLNFKLATQAGSFSRGIKFYENIFYNGGGIYFSTDPTMDFANTEVYNNVISYVNPIYAPNLQVWNNIISGGYWCRAGGTPTYSNYNDFWPNEKFQTGVYTDSKTIYNTLTDWQNGTGMDINSLHQDPLYVNPGSDFHLQANSPLIGQGRNGLDIGAYPRNDGTIIGPRNGADPPEDTTPPHTSGHNPDRDATGVARDTNIVIHVEDSGDGVDIASIVMTVQGLDVTPDITITGSSSDYIVTYNPPSDFAYEQVVNVTIDAQDRHSPANVMTQDSYSFTIEEAPDITPPSIPGNLNATANGQRIDLTWNASTDPETGISGYNLYRGASSGGESFYRDLANVTNYQDTETQPNTTYYYKLSALNGAGLESDLSNEDSATTVDEPPQAPQNLAATPGDNLVNLFWDDNPESDISHYNIYKGTTSGFTPTIPIASPSINSYTDNNATNGITYYYRISAVDQGNNESGYSQEVSATPSEETNLIAYWKFDEGSGSIAIDSSGQGNDGTIYGGATWLSGDDSISGSCLSFDGNDDYVAISGFMNVAPTAEITIAAWVNVDAGDTNSLFRDQTASNTNRINAHVPYGGEVFWDFGNKDTVGRLSYTPSGGFPFGTWQHFAFVSSNSGGYQRIYRNGVLEASDQDAGTFTQYDGDLDLSSRTDSANNRFDGAIDEVRIYSRVLTQGEILALYEQDVEPDTTPPDPIVDLTASTGTDTGEIDLTWTSTGDDANVGTATEYIIKYLTSEITDTNWEQATTVSNSLSPKSAGSSESFTVGSLTPGETYYFAIKVQDEVPNTSDISNSPYAVAREANNPPEAFDQEVSTDEDIPVAITLTGSDADNDPLTYSTVTVPTNGTLTGTAPNLTYTPNRNYNATDTFTFTVNNGTADSAPATVSITITPVNDPPIIEPIDDIEVIQYEYFRFHITHFPPEADQPLVETLYIIHITDPDGSIVSYHWNFGDGVSTETQNPVHTYEKLGTYNVTLEVTDDKGAKASYTLKVTVKEIPKPEIVLTKIADKYSAKIGDIITYTITYENVGKGDARDVLIVDTVPEGTTYMQGSATDDPVFDGTILKWTIQSLPAGASGSVGFKVEVK